MDDKPMECSKCGGDMQAGQILSPMRNALGMVLSPNLAEWYAGEMRSDFWKGLELPEEKHPITIYRCKKCGYLECYAN